MVDVTKLQSCCCSCCCLFVILIEKAHQFLVSHLPCFMLTSYVSISQISFIYLPFSLLLLQFFLPFPFRQLLPLHLALYTTCSPLSPIGFEVARNEVKNSSFAQRSAHRDSRIWRPEVIEPAAERKRRARRRRRTFKSAYSDPQILPQCNISSNYPL